MDERTARILVQSGLFSGITADELDDLFKNIPFKICRYDNNSIIQLRGDLVEDLRIIMSGKLSAEIHGSGGKNLLVETLCPSSAIASGILFSEDNRLPVTLVAKSDVEIICIGKKEVIGLCQSSTVFMQNFLTDMGSRISFLAEKIRLLQFSTIRQKICGYILGLSGEREKELVTLGYNREKLAELMSVARPSLSREFSNLVSMGFISVVGREVSILDRKAIEEVMAED